MSQHESRRRFLFQSLSAGGLITLGDFRFLSSLPLVGSAEAQSTAGTVPLNDEVAPLVRLIEQTPQNRLLEEFAHRIRGGLGYRQVLAAVQLASVLNVEPRPSVGHKFHSVLAVNSCHLASLSSPPEHRWLPIFWALDYFKDAANRDVQERGDWQMSVLDESRVPAAHRSREAFQEAMSKWDPAAADVAIAGFARSAGINEIYESLFRLGIRDFRSIGHKAIFVANSYRTLQTIGEQHSEPILRSLAYALTMYDGGNPADSDHDADKPYRINSIRVQDIRREWLDGKPDDGATQEMLGTLRSANYDEASATAVEILNRGVSPQSLWDAYHLSAAEQVMRQPAIVGLHAATTANAFAYAYRTTADDETRRLATLQLASFLTMFRESQNSRGRVRDISMKNLEDVGGDSNVSLDTVFAKVGNDPLEASRATLQWLQREDAQPRDLVDAARVLVYLKSNDAHDYKYSSAVLEDYLHVSPRWRNLFLAMSVNLLQSSGRGDSPLVARTKAAFES